MGAIIPLIAGLLFGAGLNIAQMTNPSKILKFLDVAGVSDGTWDPSLLCVFAGALPVMFVAYRIQKKMPKPAWNAKFLIPSRRDIDARLVVGSVIFGIGWGIAGLCPGPAVAILPLATSTFVPAIVFFGGMLAGMALAGKIDDAWAPKSPATVEMGASSSAAQG